MSARNADKQKLSAPQRREVLKKLGRFATASAPAVTLLLAAQTRPSRAQPTSGCKAGLIVPPTNKDLA